MLIHANNSRCCSFPLKTRCELSHGAAPSKVVATPTRPRGAVHVRATSVLFDGSGAVGAPLGGFRVLVQEAQHVGGWWARRAPMLAVPAASTIPQPAALAGTLDDTVTYIMPIRVSMVSNSV
jgi:hypothetical protein